MRVLSLGAGVQSSTLLLMAERGEIDRPDYAIFADTQWEPAAVYRHLQYLKTQTSIPIITVTAGNLRENATTGGHFTDLPAYCVHVDGHLSMLSRQCTNHAKIVPITNRVRELNGGIKPPVEQFLGISLDEVYRMKPSQVKWIVRRWPLVEKRMRRGECVEWLRTHGYPLPPKSACLGCPFTNDARWSEMKASRPSEFADAANADRTMRNLAPEIGQYFLHRSCKPLDEVDFTTEEERGQTDMFNNECEGMCGV